MEKPIRFNQERLFFLLQELKSILFYLEKMTYLIFLILYLIKRLNFVFLLNNS
jgi:hypothetical protein